MSNVRKTAKKPSRHVNRASGLSEANPATQAQAQTSFISQSQQQSDTERSHGNNSTVLEPLSLMHPGVMMQTMGLDNNDMPSPISHDTVTNGGSRLKASQITNAIISKKTQSGNLHDRLQQNMSIKIKNVATAKQITTGSGAQADSVRESAGTQIEAVSPFRTKASSALRLNDPAPIGETGSNKATQIIDILVNDQNLQKKISNEQSNGGIRPPSTYGLASDRTSLRGANDIISQRRPVPQSCFSPQGGQSRNNGKKVSTLNTGNSFQKSQNSHRKNIPASQGKKGSLVRTIANNQQVAAAAGQTEQQQFLNTDGFLQISQKKVQINHEMLDYRNKQLQSTGFRQKDVKESQLTNAATNTNRINSAAATPTLELYKNTNARLGRLDVADQTLSRKHSSRMQRLKDESIMGEHVDAEMLKSMDTTAQFAVPDVYIHNRGTGRVTEGNRSAGMTGNKMMKSTVISRNNEMVKLQSSLSDVTSGGSSSVRSKPHKEHVLRNQTLFLNALSDQDLMEQGSPKAANERQSRQKSSAKQSGPPQLHIKNQHSMQMTRSKQNPVKISRIFESMGSGRQGADDNSLERKLNTPDVSSSFFSPRENLGRILTTRTLAINTNEKSAVKTSFDPLSPTQYRANFASTTKSRPVNVQLQRRYTASQNKSGRPQSLQFEGQHANQQLNQQSWASKQRQTKGVFSRIASKTDQAVTSSQIVSRALSSDDYEIKTQTNTVVDQQPKSGIFQTKPDIELNAHPSSMLNVRGMSASNFNSGSNRQRVAELSRSLQQTTSVSGERTFSWDQMRAVDKKIVKESFRNMDPRYRCVTNVGIDPLMQQQPKSHVRVPDFLKEHLSTSRSVISSNANNPQYIAGTATSLELQQVRPSLLSSRTQLQHLTDALNTERRMNKDTDATADQKIHVHDWLISSINVKKRGAAGRVEPNSLPISTEQHSAESGTEGNTNTVLSSIQASIYVDTLPAQTRESETATNGLNVPLKPEDMVKGEDQSAQVIHQSPQAVLEMLLTEGQLVDSAKVEGKEKVVRKMSSERNLNQESLIKNMEAYLATDNGGILDQQVTDLSDDLVTSALFQICSKDLDSSVSGQAESISLEIDSRISGPLTALREDEPTFNGQRLDQYRHYTKKWTHQLPSRADGKQLPLSADFMPQNDLQKAIHQLATRHNFEKLAELKPHEVTSDIFISKLHGVNIEQMERLLNKKSSVMTDETSKKDQSEEEPFPPRIMQTTVGSVENKSFIKNNLTVGTMVSVKNGDGSTERSFASLTPSEDVSGSQMKLVASFIPAKLLERVKNPLFQLDERPEVCEEMFNDIIYSYQPVRNIDIHDYKASEDYLSSFRELTKEESNSLDVRIAHDLMSLWKHHIKPEEKIIMKKIRTKKKTYKQNTAHQSVMSVNDNSLNLKKQEIMGDSIATSAGHEVTSPLHLDMPPPVLTAFGNHLTGDLTSYKSIIDDATCLKQDLASHIMKNNTERQLHANLLLNLVQETDREKFETVHSDVSSQNITPTQRKIRDINSKSVVFNLYEAASLNSVNVNLAIDFEAILKLQRKVADYGQNRIQNVLPLTIFDDYLTECDVIRQELIHRRKNFCDPILVTVTFKDENDKRIQDLGLLLDYVKDRQQFIVQVDDKRYFMHRLNIQVEEIETRAVIEERRVAAMTLSKSVLLRLNVERILFKEVIRQKPEMRQPAHFTNAIERLVDLDRLRKHCKHGIGEDQVRALVAQFESLYCFSLAKCIIMSEAEQDEPRVSCMLTGYSVERQFHNQTPYYGLQAYEKAGKPIDHLIGKQDCKKVLESFSLLGRKCFLDAFKFITERTIAIIENRPIFQLPVEEDTAHMLYVRPNLKKIFKSTKDIMQRLVKFPLTSLEFTEVQQELARNFSEVAVNIWQDSIIQKLRKTIYDNFQGAKKSILTKDQSKINPFIVRFLKSANQMQVNHLFCKYEKELRNMLEFLLTFANLCYDFRAQQSYLDYGLEKFEVHFSKVSLIQSTISVSVVEPVVNTLIKNEAESAMSRQKARRDINPFRSALKRVRPKHATQTIQSSPSLDNIYLELLKTLNNMMYQFTKIPAIPHEIYPNANLSSKYIVVSADLLSRNISETVNEEDINEVMDSVRSTPSSMMKSQLREHDSVYCLRRQIEFVMTDIVEKANKQLLKLRPFVKFIGYKFEDMIFDLRSLLFQNQMDMKIKTDDDDFTNLLDFSTDFKTQNERLIDLVTKTEITDNTYTSQFDELKTAYWKVQLEVEDYYNFGLVRLDCREFKKQAEEGISGLITAFKDHLLEEFQSLNDEQTKKNEDCWEKVNAVHSDIDKTIEQIDYVHQLQNEDFFEDMVTFVRYIATKKTFLDKLKVLTNQSGLYKFLDLHHFPTKLRDRLKIKNRDLRIAQKKIQRHINLHTAETKQTLVSFKKNFKAFREYTLPTKTEFEAKLNDDTREHILTTLDKIAEDGHTLLKEDVVWDANLVDDLCDKIDTLNSNLRQVEEDTRTINRRQEALQMKVSDFPELYDLKQRIKPLVQLWETIHQFNSMVEEWKERPIKQLTVDEVEEFCSEWYRKLLFVMRNSNLTKHAGPKVFCDYIMKEIENIRMYLPVLSCLKVNGLDKRHLEAIGKEVGENIWPNKITFRWLAKRELHKGRKFEIIKAITDQASKEYAIRLTIEAVDSELEHTKMSPQKYRDSFILKNLPRDLSNFTECTLKINSISSNPAAKTFRERIERLQKELNRILHFFNLWNDLQKYWAYLLPIFVQRDIAHHMPDQYEKFVMIDRIYRREVVFAETLCPTYKLFAKRDCLRDNINTMMSQFEYLMKCLIKYLEKKREYFPRLYFLSNEQIIEIVGMLEDISQLERNLFKMFEGIDKLIIVYKDDWANLQNDQDSGLATSGNKSGKEVIEASNNKRQKTSSKKVWRAQDSRLFKQGLQTCLGTRPVRDLGEDLGRVLGLQNPDGELLEFSGHVKITETIEQWLKRVEYSMKYNVARTIQQAFESFKNLEFRDWIKLWPTQFILVVMEVDLTMSLERVFDYEIQLQTHQRAISTVKDPHKKQQLLDHQPPKKLKDEDGRVITTVQVFKDKQAEVLSQISSLSMQIRDQLSYSMRERLNSLIINRVHSRDVIKNMLDHSIEKSTDFLWSIQLKYVYQERYSSSYLAEKKQQQDAQRAERRRREASMPPVIDPSRHVLKASKDSDLKDVVQALSNEDKKKDRLKEEAILGKMDMQQYPVFIRLRMIEAEHPYGYEFLSNTSRLVITPLTERCFQSLFLAMHYKYGGAPIGPAGTGKTESIKEMGKNIARHCYVFNCQSQIDFFSMSKFFKGLAANGTWVCFDEFNRLEIGVLAIISQLIIALSDAKHEESAFIQIEETLLPFNPNCGLFITMNPFHYGRTPLPDNLKALFRQVTMVVPDTLFIAEIILYSVGFANARSLAVKITRTFSMIQQQLQGELHYDFGLRTVKQVLIFAGDLKLRCMKVKSRDNIQAEKAVEAQGEYVEGITRLVPPKRKRSSKHAAGKGSSKINVGPLKNAKDDDNDKKRKDSLAMQNQQVGGGYDILNSAARITSNLTNYSKDESAVRESSSDFPEYSEAEPTSPMSKKGGEDDKGTNETIIEESSMESASDQDSESSEDETEEEESSTDERMKRMIKQEEQKHTTKESSEDTALREVDSSCTSSSETSEDSDIDTLGLDLRYIMKDLGCTTKKVIKNEDLLDQFIVLKSITDKNLPKLLFKDMQILQHIVGDVFPNIPMTQVISGGKTHVIEMIDQRLSRRNLFRGQEFIQNVFNIFEALSSRHGIMVLGPPAGGKTTCIRIVLDVLHQLHQKEFQQKQVLFQKMKAAKMGISIVMVKGEVLPKETNDPTLMEHLTLNEEEKAIVTGTCQFKGVSNFSLNPKSVTMSSLMGFFDDTSREWTDGVLSSSIRHCSQENTGKRMIVTCDGPIEPDWVENLNSVLDDNKRLSLQTGETIYLTPQMNIFLEASRLDDCTPATTSRCAICYIRRETLPVKAQFNLWLHSLPKILHDQQERLDLYANYFISEILENFFHPEHLIYPLMPSWAITTFVRLFDSLIFQYRNEKYNDMRILKKIYNRMAIEEAQKKNARATERRRKTRQDQIEMRKDVTRARLEKMRTSQTFTTKQISNLKRELLDEDDSQQSGNSSSVSGKESNDSKKEKRKAAEEGKIIEVQMEDEEDFDDSLMTSEKSSSLLVRDEDEEDGSSKNSESISGKDETEDAKEDKEELKVQIEDPLVHLTAKLDFALIKSKESEPISCSSIQKTHNEAQDVTKRVSQKIHANSSNIKNALRSKTMRQVKRSETDTQIVKKRKVFVPRKDQTERLKPPEHNFVENDFLFEQSVRNKNYWIDCFFLYSLIWAFGSILTEEARTHFNTWLHQVIKQKNVVRLEQEVQREEQEAAEDQEQQRQSSSKKLDAKDRNKLMAMQTWLPSSSSNESMDSLILYNATQDFVIGQVDHMEANLPEEINVFDIVFDPAVGRFQNWRGVYNYVHDERSNDRQKKSLLSMTIATQDYLRIEYLLDRQLEIKKPIMLLGPTAQGKSTFIRQYVYEKDIPSRFRRYDIISCSINTDGKQLQQLMEKRLSKQNKTLVKPPEDKHQVFFIDDLHMAHQDRWKISSACELFRQYLDYGGWYNLEKIYFKKVRDVNFVTTISTRNQSKELISDRVGWHQGAIGIINFDGCHIEQIYQTILNKAFMNANSNTIVATAPQKLLQASMEFFKKYNEQLKPSPTMFLFKINTRHLIYFMKGFLDAPVSYFQTMEHIAYMWVHEVCRTVLDRYADPNEQDRVYDMVKQIASFAFEIRPKIFPRNCRLVQFYYGQPESETTYNEKADERKLIGLLNDTLESYNKLHYHGQLSVVIFGNLVEKTLKINRSMLMPMSNTILVADQGQGAHSLVKIAIQLSKATDNHLFANDSEQSEDWRAALRSILLGVAVESKNTCVLHMIENHFVDGVIETLEALAAHGELFQLFNTEEFDSLLNQVKYKTQHTSVRGKERTESQIIEDIREHIHTHLHMLLQLTPRSKILLGKLRDSSHLLDSSTLIYFGEWSDFGFEYIAMKHLEEQSSGTVASFKNLETLTKAMIEMYHDTTKNAQLYYQETDHYVYVSPQMFETFVQTFKRLFNRRAIKLLKHQERFRVGLAGIRRTQEFTEAKQDELSKQSPMLVKKQRELEGLIDELDVEKQQVQKQITLKLQVEDNICNTLKEAEEIQKQCDKFMREAIPTFKSAVEGLLQITKKEINELKSIVRPLPTIRMLMTAVCLLLDEAPSPVSQKDATDQNSNCYWKTAISTRVLADRNIIHRMTQIDPTLISTNTMRKLEDLIGTGLVSPDKVQKATQATRGIFSWVMAVRNYFYVYKSSEPLRNKLILADRQLKEFQQRRAQNEKVLLELEKKLQRLRDLHAEKEEEVKLFQKEIEEVFILKSKSARLLNELAGEKQKWLVCELVAATNITNMEGDSLISAAMVCFLAPFTQKTRETLFQKWLVKIAGHEINITRNLDFNAMFSNPLKVKIWLENGLPNDSYSIQNAIILKSAQLQPILIDPATQANKWLRKELHDVKILNMQTSRFLQELKMCIKFGSTIIIENVDETISNKLFPLFVYEKAKVQGQRKTSAITICIDQTNLQMDPSFRMYITSVHPNPDFGADISLLSNFINFSVTMEAFEAQIMSLLLSELETEQDAKQRIYRRQALVWIKRLKVIEDEILEELKKQQPQEMLIKREHLIEKLLESRTVTKQTGKTLMEINAAMKLLMTTSKLYKPVSQRASKFYFVANDIVKLNNMYQFTHEWFIGFFKKLISETIIDDTDKKKKEESIRKLQANFVKIFYQQMCQTLFEKDKLLFSFLLAYKELEVEFKIDKRQVEFFIKGGLQQEDEIFSPKNLVENRKTDEQLKQEFVQDELQMERRQKTIPWIKRQQWRAIDKLAGIAPFNQPNRVNHEHDVAAHIEKYPRAWWDYINGKRIHEYTMDSFTLKDDDGGSIHYSDDEEGEEPTPNASDANQSAKPVVKRPGDTMLNELSMSSDQLGSLDSFSESVSSKDFKSKASSADMQLKQLTYAEMGGRHSTKIQLDAIGRNKTRMNAKVIKKVVAQKFVDLGVPGAYDKFNFKEAIKHGENLKRRMTSDVVDGSLMQKEKEKLKEAKLRTKLDEELDDIFAMDADEGPKGSSESSEESAPNVEEAAATGKPDENMGDAGSDSASEQDAIDAVFDDFKHKNVEEDQKIALAIIQGIAEYAEYKVQKKKKLTKRQQMKQHVINSHMVRLCIMRCFHPDKLYSEIKSFISFFLGRTFTEQPPFEFASIYKQTSKYVPILVMLGPNVNPYTELKSLKMIQPATSDTKLDFQPLGQIAHERISKKIITAACEGNWLLLDNLQLSIEITANLHKFLENMYFHSKDVKQQLSKKAKLELKDMLEKKKEVVNQDKSTNQDSAIAMELMLLQQSILQDSAETSFNDMRTDRSWHQGEVSVEDKSFSISLALQDKLKNIIKKKKIEARAELIARLLDFDVQQKLADENSEMRELTQEEKLMKELVFPDAFPFPIHKKFRLWVSVIPVPSFPANFARRCLKISLELPVDIRPNTIKSINLLAPQEIAAVTHNSREFKRMLFSMTVMHAVINQRERFGSFGWTQPYFFSPNDLEISIKMLAEMCQHLKVAGNIPLKLLRYLVGVINYGGKLTQKADEKILDLQIKTFLNRRVFDESSKGATDYERMLGQLDEHIATAPYDLTGTQSDPLAEPNALGERLFQIFEGGCRVRGYWMPNAVSDLRAMKEHVRESFPLQDAPEIFGLHHNATIKAGLTMAEKIMMRTYSYQFVVKRPKQPALTQIQTNKRNTMIYEYFRAKLKEVILKIPHPIPPDSYEDAIPLEREKPFNTLLTKEIQRYNTLLSFIRANLDNTYAAMEGLRHHSDETEETFDCLQQDLVPNTWVLYSYPCHESMSVFVMNLAERVSYIKQLLDQAANDKFTSRKFWIPGFFNQKNFLMTLMQEVARKQRIPIESLVTNYRIMGRGERMYSQIKAEGTNSYYIDGLYLYGADWIEEQQTIADLPKFAITGQMLPSIHLIISQQNLESAEDSDEQSATDKRSVQTGGEQQTVPDYLSNEEHQMHLFRKTHYMCPMYVNFKLNRNGDRGSADGMLITTIPVPVKQRKPTFWIKRNVCILCYNDNTVD